MKNKEKYKELLETYALAGVDWGKTDGEIKPCGELSCDECDFNDISKPSCALECFAWLNLEERDEEYKEPEVDWEKTPVDTKVTVSDDGINWYNRHFAGVKNGKIYTWVNGATSWSTKGNYKRRWNYISLVEVENE